ncbi:MAG: phosphoribosylanthranilate isomerase [Firmicutes bacterium]|nr:phosphoribosylanthranilate isomerase [Bacillota bacterium]
MNACGGRPELGSRGGRVWIKICGVSDIETARIAAGCGAGAIGFVFVGRSRRYIPPGLARQISCGLPRNIEKVGVFVDESPARVAEIARFCGLDLVQLHGGESPEYCKALSLPIIKAFRVESSARGGPEPEREPRPGLEPARELLGAMDQYAALPNVARFLLDAYVPGNPGGTGRIFDWIVAASVVGQARRPVILAGGLAPENVAHAIKVVRPFGVDVSSGVETCGRKDHEKIRRFIEEAEGAPPEACVDLEQLKANSQEGEPAT